MSPRDRMIVGVLAVVAVMGGFWFALIAPKRDDVSALDEQITQAEQRRATAEQAVATGVLAKERYREDYSTVVRLGKAVPADDDVASLVFQLDTIADRYDVDFRSLKLSAAGTAAPAPAPEPQPAEEPAGEDEAAKSSNAAPETETPAAPVISQAPPGSVVGAAGLSTMPFTFIFEGSFLKLQKFLDAIDGLTVAKKDQITVSGRLLTVDGFSLAGAASGLPRIKAEVKATAYLVPEAQGLLNGATPSGPATGQAATGQPAAPNATATVGGQG